MFTTTLLTTTLLNTDVLTALPTAVPIEVLASPAATELADGVRGGRGDGGPRVLFPLLLLLLLVGGFLFLRRRRGGGHHHAVAGPNPPAPVTPNSSAMTLLEERFARGEVSEVEFDRRRRVLRGEPFASAPPAAPEAAAPAPSAADTPPAADPAVDPAVDETDPSDQR